jgi:uncharacterized membrane protein YkgB
LRAPNITVLARPSHTLVALEAQLSRFCERVGPAALRLALAVTFVWFGALKVANASPVADVVARVIPLAPARFIVPALGAFEVALGLALLSRRTLPVALVAFFLHMIGTFSVLFRLPALAFRDGNPLLLTTLGEFVLKNIVLLSAGLVVMGTMRRRQTDWPEGARVARLTRAAPTTAPLLDS